MPFLVIPTWVKCEPSSWVLKIQLRETACTEVWFNELRLADLNEEGGWAALGRVDFKLADLGTLYFSGNRRGIGFGNIEQRINERSREKLEQFDAATNLELGKLLPKNAGISIPFYAGISKITSTPQYDPYDLDIKLKDKLNAASAESERFHPAMMLLM